MNDREIKKRMELARAYNDSLNNRISEDPYGREKREKGRKAYAHMFEVREKIGHVEIPKIAQDISVYAGTSEDVLQKGAGHLGETSLPRTETVRTQISRRTVFFVDQVEMIEPGAFTKVSSVLGDD